MPAGAESGGENGLAAGFLMPSGQPQDLGQQPVRLVPVGGGGNGRAKAPLGAGQVVEAAISGGQVVVRVGGVFRGTGGPDGEFQGQAVGRDRDRGIGRLLRRDLHGAGVPEVRAGSQEGGALVGVLRFGESAGFDIPPGGGKRVIGGEEAEGEQGQHGRNREKRGMSTRAGSFERRNGQRHQQRKREIGGQSGGEGEDGELLGAEGGGESSGQRGGGLGGRREAGGVETERREGQEDGQARGPLGGPGVQEDVVGGFVVEVRELAGERGGLEARKDPGEGFRPGAGGPKGQAHTRGIAPQPKARAAPGVFDIPAGAAAQGLAGGRVVEGHSQHQHRGGSQTRAGGETGAQPEGQEHAAQDHSQDGRASAAEHDAGGR